MPEPQAYVPGHTTMWNQSWRDLYERLADVILFYAKQEGLNDHSAQDVLQETMMTVLRAQRGEVACRLPEKGSFRQWLKGVVHNRIRSIRRKDQKEYPLPQLADGDHSDHDALPEISEPPPDFESVDEERWQLAILRAALQKVQERVTEDNFKIYLALLEEKASPDQLAQQYAKTTNNIYRIKNSCQTMVFSEARAIQVIWSQMGLAPALEGSYA